MSDNTDTVFILHAMCSEFDLHSVLTIRNFRIVVYAYIQFDLCNNTEPFYKTISNTASDSSQ